DLKNEVKEKRFREDLFFRLNVIPIHIPPLRDRKEDLWPLAEFFTARFCTLNNVPTKSWAKDAIQYLHTYTWPGNVRELENAVERAVALAIGNEITEKDLVLFDKAVLAPSVPLENTLPDVFEEERTPVRPLGDVFLQDSVCSLEDLTRRYIEF